MSDRNSETQHTDEDWRKKIFDSLVNETLALSKLIVGTATAFLGGSLVFLEKIAPQRTPCSLIVLFLAWLLLIAAILSILCMHRISLISGWHALEGRSEKAQGNDERARRLSLAAVMCMVLGVALMMLFGAINLWSQPGG